LPSISPKNVPDGFDSQSKGFNWKRDHEKFDLWNEKIHNKIEILGPDKFGITDKWNPKHQNFEDGEGNQKDKKDPRPAIDLDEFLRQQREQKENKDKAWEKLFDDEKKY
jgi:hypothetical protein